MALILALVMSLLMGDTVAPNVHQGERQADLASALTHGTDRERQVALAQILAIPPRDRSIILIDAAIQEAGRWRAMLDDRGRRYNAGEQLDPLPETDYLPQLLQVLADAPDPKVIQPLCRFLDLGGTVIVGDALARFGDRAAPCVVVVASDHGARSDRASGSLHVLARMLQVADPPVSPATHARFHQIAVDRLTRAGSGADVGTIFRAAELALELEDSVLAARVRELSTDTPSVNALGLEDEAGVALLQRLLRNLLSSKDFDREVANGLTRPTSGEKFGLPWAAIDLAGVLHDRELDSIVRSLAVEEQEVGQSGIPGPKLVGQTPSARPTV